MINAVIAIELEAYLEHDGQIEAVHDQSQPVDGYALYLRYENERGTHWRNGCAITRITTG
ncbi:hypothetical protein NMD14_05955 [Aeromonas veronii]